MYTWSDVESAQDRCAFCSCDNQNVLERHHRVPSRFGGTDSDANLVTVCANCHSVLERIYNKDFWERAKSLTSDSDQTTLNEDIVNENAEDRSDSVGADLDQIASRIVSEDRISEFQLNGAQLDLHLLQWYYNISLNAAKILKKLIEREYRKENDETLTKKEESVDPAKLKKQVRDDLIKRFYEQSSMTQREISEVVDLTQSTVHKILNGE